MSWPSNPALSCLYPIDCLTAETFLVPLFHAGALYTFIGLTILQEMPCIFGISGKFPSGEFLTECLENMNATGASLAPFILESMVNDERAMKQLAKLNLVIYGGGKTSLDAISPLIHDTDTHPSLRQSESRSRRKAEGWRGEPLQCYRLYRVTIFRLLSLFSTLSVWSGF